MLFALYVNNYLIIMKFLEYILQFVNKATLFGPLPKEMREIFLYFFGSPALTQIFIKSYIGPSEKPNLIISRLIAAL